MAFLRRAGSTAAAVAGAITSLGWTAAALGVLAWVGSWRSGWDELAILAAGLLAAVAFASVFALRRPSLRVRVSVEPHRVVVGEQAVGEVAVQNTGRRRALPFQLESPVGRALARIDVPSLGAGEAHGEVFVIPTQRRSVVDIGPVRSVSGDPLGLVRRVVSWTDVAMLYVHPKTVRLGGMTSGWIRDLEGRTTKDLSTSDVAFHALREYVPGDDRRHIHWRSSAKAGRLLVRQFVDTRRSHLAVLLSTNPGDYADADEFELAVSVVGSLALAAAGNEQQLSLISGGRPVASHSAQRVLDELAGVELGEGLDLRRMVQRAVPLVRTASVVVVTAGSGVSLGDLLSAAGRAPSEVRAVALRCQPGADTATHAASATTVLTVGALDDLPRLMRAMADR